MIRIEIDTKNAAFEEPKDEVCRILRSIHNNIEREGLTQRQSTSPWYSFRLYDVNGNDVGFFEYKEEPTT